MSKLTCSIIQPHYLPWIGYFNLISRSDIFVFLDDVEFTIGEWKNRNKIRKNYNSDEAKWLTVPINKKDHFSLLKNCRIADEKNWREKHINSIIETYKKTTYFEYYFNDIKDIINNKKFNILSKLNIELINLICKFLSIRTKMILSSDLGCEGNKDQKPLNICKKLQSNRYLATNKSSDYLKYDEYKSQNILVEFQNYNHANYDQYFNNKKLNSIKYLSIIDLLFNHGPASTKYIN